MTNSLNLLRVYTNQGTMLKYNWRGYIEGNKVCLSEVISEMEVHWEEVMNLGSKYASTH